MVLIVNEAIEDLLEAVQRIGRKTDAVTLVSGTSEYGIAADLHGHSIAKIEMTDLRELEYLPWEKYKSLEPEIRNHEWASDEPHYWKLLPD